MTEMNKYINFIRDVKIRVLRTIDFHVPEDTCNAEIYRGTFDIKVAAIDAVSNEGLFLEFGVWRGESINFLAALIRPRIIYGFDSFKGLPEFWRRNCPKGTFNLNGRIPQVRKNVKLIKGQFDKTLPKFVKQIKSKKAAFVHIDSDLYSSCKTILNNLVSLDLDGTVMLFDEFYNYSGWETGEYKALMEFLSESKYAAQYIGRVKYGEQVMIKLKKKNNRM